MLIFPNTKRRIQQLQGEVFFDVAKDSQRPFLVESGNAHVRVTGTQFSVNRRTGSVRVGVLEGRVEVSSFRKNIDQDGDVGTGRPAMLTAGEKVVANRTGELSAVSAISSEEIIGWQAGRLVYRNEALVDIVEDINRYSDDVIYIVDAKIKPLKVTMSLSLDELDNMPNVIEKHSSCQLSRK